MVLTASGHHNFLKQKHAGHLLDHVVQNHVQLGTHVCMTSESLCIANCPWELLRDCGEALEVDRIH